MFVKQLPKKMAGKFLTTKFVVKNINANFVTKDFQQSKLGVTIEKANINHKHKLG